jgi:5-formyltetrahydrofolate cyclo-ligase
MNNSILAQQAIDLMGHIPTQGMLSDELPVHTNVAYFASNGANSHALATEGLSCSEIRKLVRQYRNGIATEEQEQLALIASRHILAEIQNSNAKHVALYQANDGELATHRLIDILWQEGVTTYLPRLHPFRDGHLIFLKFDSNSVLEANQYGIMEPKLDVTQLMPAYKLDVILTPLVAFDIQGNRIGMGGGYYDRCLGALTPEALAMGTPEFQAPTPPIAIGFAHDCQEVSIIPIQSWDIPLAMVITPTRRIKPQLKA